LETVSHVYAVRLYPSQCRCRCPTTNRRASPKIQRPPCTKLNSRYIWEGGDYGWTGTDLIATGRFAGLSILDQCEIISHHGVADSPLEMTLDGHFFLSFPSASEPLILRFLRRTSDYLSPI
jgi:hypothetical protein